MKNILYFFNNQEDCEPFGVINQLLEEYVFDMTNNYAHAIELTNERDYEIVIVDFTSEDGAKLLITLMQNNKEQKIITLSEKLQCSVLQGCDYCVKNYKRRRVFKPLSMDDVIKTILNYDEIDCLYRNKFENIIEILDKIIGNYDNFEYEPQQHRIKALEKNSSHLVFNDLLKITDILKESNIEFCIDEKYNINLSN